MKRPNHHLFRIATAAACTVLLLLGCDSDSASPLSPTLPAQPSGVLEGSWDVVISGSHEHEGTLFLTQSGTAVSGALAWDRVEDWFWGTHGNNDVTGSITGYEFTFRTTSDCTEIEDGVGSATVSDDGHRLVGTLHSEVHCDHQGEPEDWDFSATKH